MQSPNSCKYESEDAITEWANGCNGKEVEFIKPIATILHKDYKKMSFKVLVSSTTFRSYATPSIVLLGNKKNNIQQNINKFMRLRSYKRDIQAMSLDTFYERYFE